jgi:hypothetical protein
MVRLGLAARCSRRPAGATQEGNVDLVAVFWTVRPAARILSALALAADEGGEEQKDRMEDLTRVAESEWRRLEEVWQSNALDDSPNDAVELFMNTRATVAALHTMATMLAWPHEFEQYSLPAAGYADAIANMARRLNLSVPPDLWKQDQDTTPEEAA